MQPISDQDELPTATIRRHLEDFQVAERLAYEPSGHGGHAFITFRKSGLTTIDAVRQLAAVLDVPEREVGFAGMKDKRAVTTQTASFLFPEKRDLDTAVGEIQLTGVQILNAVRHPHKLRTGQLRSNRFKLVLRDLNADAIRTMVERLATVQAQGVPNAFGPQRFGRDGGNAERALAWLSGQGRGPRGKKQQRLLFSALQSWLFNRVLKRREQQRTWNTVLAGDLAKKHDTGGMFIVPADAEQLADAQQRAAEGKLSATGPMCGAKMRMPEGQPAEIEKEIINSITLEPNWLERNKRLGQGTRRPLRLWVEQLCYDRSEDDSYLELTFVLPKGGYATTVLSQICQPTEPAPPDATSDY